MLFLFRFVLPYKLAITVVFRFATFALCRTVLLLTFLSFVLVSPSFARRRGVARGVQDSDAPDRISIALFSEDFPSRPDENGVFHLISDEHVYNRGACGGGNMSPHLAWQLKPKNNNFIKSFAVTMYTPSVPTGSGWWHWIVYDIPPDVNEIETGASPFGESDVVRSDGRVIGFSGISDSGSFGYAGPCHFVESGTHKYTITVYGLRVDRLPVSGNMSNAAIRMAILRHTVVKASFNSFY